MVYIWITTKHKVMKCILKKIVAAEKARTSFNKKCDDALIEILKNFDFETPEDNFFHFEYQPSDGFVLADSYSNVYNLHGILRHIV